MWDIWARYLVEKHGEGEREACYWRHFHGSEKVSPNAPVGVTGGERIFAQSNRVSRPRRDAAAVSPSSLHFCPIREISSIIDDYCYRTLYGRVLCARHCLGLRNDDVSSGTLRRLQQLRFHVLALPFGECSPFSSSVRYRMAELIIPDYRDAPPLQSVLLPRCEKSSLWDRERKAETPKG